MFAPAQRAQAEDRERHQRVLGARLDRDEGRQQHDRQRRSGPASGSSPSPRTRRPPARRPAPPGRRSRTPRRARRSWSRSRRGSPGAARGASAAAISAIGTFTHSTHSQPRYSVSTPPSSTPAAPPAPATAPHTPSAVLRSRPSVKVVVTIESAAGEMMRRAEALEGARGDQLPLLGGEPAGQRGQAEQDQAGDEHPPPPEQVGQAAAQQQEAAEGEHVGVDHPRQVVLRKLQVRADRRQRHVHDRGVEDDHELGHGQQGQGEPLRPVGTGGAFSGHGAPGDSAA